jgi:hypothetical protein
MGQRYTTDQAFRRNRYTGPAPIEDRFWAKVDKSSDCWLWLGCRHVRGGRSMGYGAVMHEGKKWLAHRMAYTLSIGPLPADKTIDHLCRQPLCVNPEHMELVSMRENILRGEGLAAQNARKTHCKRGHEFNPENTIVTDNRGHPGRRCRTCAREQNAQYYRERKDRR